jgi:endonuclease/exonuclease/phosphatase family metal-dependent hydrolase
VARALVGHDEAVQRAREGWRRRARLVLAVALLGVAACSTSPAPSAPAALRVMTWNVQTHAHDPPDWADLVARLRPDVLALQEICVREADELAAILQRGPIRPPTPAEANAPVNAALGPACDTAPDAVDFGLAVLSRLPVTDARVTTYPPDRRDEQRGYLTLRVTTPAGVAVTVRDTHIGLDGVAGEQIRHLAEDASRNAPGVVLGDLNVGVDDPELAPLRAGFTEVDPDGQDPTTVEGKIDYIFLRGLAPAGPPEVPDTTASDHRPLVADLRLDG